MSLASLRSWMGVWGARSLRVVCVVWVGALAWAAGVEGRAQAEGPPAWAGPWEEQAEAAAVGSLGWEASAGRFVLRLSGDVVAWVPTRPPEEAACADPRALGGEAVAWARFAPGDGAAEAAYPEGVALSLEGREAVAWAYAPARGCVVRWRVSDLDGCLGSYGGAMLPPNAFDEFLVTYDEPKQRLKVEGVWLKYAPERAPLCGQRGERVLARAKATWETGRAHAEVSALAKSSRLKLRVPALDGGRGGEVEATLNIDPHLWGGPADTRAAEGGRVIANPMDPRAWRKEGGAGAVEGGLVTIHLTSAHGSAQGEEATVWAFETCDLRLHPREDGDVTARYAVTAEACASAQGELWVEVRCEVARLEVPPCEGETVTRMGLCPYREALWVDAATVRWAPMEGAAREVARYQLEAEEQELSLSVDERLRCGVSGGGLGLVATAQYFSGSDPEPRLLKGRRRVVAWEHGGARVGEREVAWPLPAAVTPLGVTPARRSAEGP